MLHLQLPRLIVQQLNQDIFLLFDEVGGLDGDIGMLLSSGYFSGFRLPAMVRWSELLIMSVLCVFGVGTKLPVHGRWVRPFY